MATHKSPVQRDLVIGAGAGLTTIRGVLGGDGGVVAHGAGGVSDDFGTAEAWAHQRTLRLADGPDEVHRRAIARLEFKKHK